MNSANKDKTDNKDKGILDSVRANTPSAVKDNAPRIVAGLKILGSTSMLFSKNKAFSIAGAGFIAAQSIIMLFADKKSEAEKEKLRKGETEQGKDSKTGLSKYFSKIFSPQKYPIESGMSIGMLSSAFWTASGVIGKDGFSFGKLLGGLLSFGSDANIVFTKEKIGAPKENQSPTGSLDYYIEELKNRPVLLSSLLNIGSDVASVVGGIHEFRRGKEINMLLSGTCLLSANLFQAMFVNKNDYNIEKTENKKPIIAPDTDKAEIESNKLQNNNKISWQERTQNSTAQHQVLSA